MKNFFNILTNVFFACVGIVTIFLTVYLFGWDFLSTYLVGNDIGMAYTAATWVDKFFPFIPEWFPLQGMGISLIQGNQIGAPFLTSLTSHLFPISLSQAMHLWEFLAVYLTAIGIMIFVLVKFRSWMAAMLAGIFYPLSSASWEWLSQIGLYGNGIAFVFYAPAILTLDLFLSELFADKRQRRLILWFSLTSLLAASTLFIHFTMGIVLLETIFIYGLIYSLITAWKNKTVFLRSLAFLILIIITSLLLAGFVLFPFLRYINIVSRNLLPVWSFEQIPYITLSALFGFSGIKSLSQNNGMWYLFFARPVWVLALLGIVMAVIKRNKTAILISVLFIFFVFYAVAPGITPWLVKTFLIFWRDIYIRSLVPAIVFLPVLAAWGCLSIGQLFAKFAPKLRLDIPVTIVVAVLAVYFLKGAPPNGSLQWPCYEGFGRWWRTAVDYCHFWDKLGKMDFSISQKSAPVNSLAGKFNFTDKDRLDISPKQGALIGVWSITSNVPLATMYWYALSLNNIFWGYEQGIYYNTASIEKPQAIPELASWLGIKDVILTKSDDIELRKKDAVDPFWRYSLDDWETTFEDKTKNQAILTFKRPPGFVTWTNRPTILVVGKRKSQAYEQVFRRATSGILPYDQALLVEGRDDGQIDQYTREELKKFDGLILYGQVYNDKEKADKLLGDYVRSGGRLFIESGWQFTNAEWQTHQTLEVVPLKQLEWNQGPTTNLKLVTDLLGKKFDVEKFATFIYYSDTWNVTTASLEDIKDWGQVVLERNGKPIIMVGNFGQGRIIWSGMNLFGHLNANPFFQEEWDFSQNLFAWLLEGKEKKDLSLSYTRPNPDKIEFSLKEDSSTYTSLLWRENWYPDWKAQIGKMENGKWKMESVPIYRAGPNLMLLRLPKTVSGEKINLEFKLSIVPFLSRIISLVTFVLLIVILVFPQVLSFMNHLVSRLSAQVSKKVLEDNEQ